MAASINHNQAPGRDSKPPQKGLTMRHPATLRSKSKTHDVTRTGVYTWRVVSGETGNQYTVWKSGTDQDEKMMCDCSWAQYRPVTNGGACGCSHVLAVIAQIQAAADRSTQVYADPDAAQRQHRHILDIGDNLLITTRKVGG